MGWVTEMIGPGSRIESVQRLPLGGWHVNHAIDVVDERHRTFGLVLRRWARAGWEADDPDYTVERETCILDVLQSSAVSAPAVVAADPEGESCDVPALLLTRLDGHPPRPEDTNADGFCSQLAETAARIHNIDAECRSRLKPYRLYYDRAHACLPSWMPVTAVWARAIAVVREPPPVTAMTMIHRDYHPENTLWSDGRLTGVVDWTQASWGPPELDVGHMRWNLVADYGQAAADGFLSWYRTITGRELHDQAYWDLVSLFDLLVGGDDDPGDVEPEDLRRFEEYAYTVLSKRG